MWFLQSELLFEDIDNRLFPHIVQQNKFYLVITTFFKRGASAHSPRVCCLASKKVLAGEKNRNNGSKFFKKKNKSPWFKCNSEGWHVLPWCCSRKNKIKEKKKVEDVSRFPSFIHLRVLLCPAGVNLYALCIKSPPKKTNKKNPAFNKYSKKIQKEVIKKPALIYTTVFVLRLISKYTHHKLIASATWLPLQSWHFLGQVDLLSWWKMANIFFWH